MMIRVTIRLHVREVLIFEEEVSGIQKNIKEMLPLNGVYT